MGKKARASRGLSMSIRQGMRANANKEAVAKVVARIAESFFFFGSHAHHLDTADWSIESASIKRSNQRTMVFHACRNLLQERRTWMSLHLVGVDTQEGLEVFLYSKEYKEKNASDIGEALTEHIEHTLKDIRETIAEGELYQGTQLHPDDTIRGYGYYLFHGEDFAIDEYEDEISDSMFEQGVFDHPFVEGEYVKPCKAHMDMMFDRQQVRLVRKVL